MSQRETEEPTESVTDIIDEEVNRYINSPEAVQQVTPPSSPSSSQSEEEEIPPGMLEPTALAGQAVASYIEGIRTSTINVREIAGELADIAKADINKHSAIAQTVRESGVTLSDIIERSGVRSVPAKLTLLGFFLKDTFNRAKIHLRAIASLPGQFDLLDNLSRYDQIQVDLANRIAIRLRSDIMSKRPTVNTRNVLSLYNFFMDLSLSGEYDSEVSQLIDFEILKRTGHMLFEKNQITIAFVLHEIYAADQLNPAIRSDNILYAVEIPTSERYVSLESFITSICESVFFLITGSDPSKSARMGPRERQQLELLLRSALQTVTEVEGAVPEELQAPGGARAATPSPRMSAAHALHELSTPRARPSWEAAAAASQEPAQSPFVSRKRDEPPVEEPGPSRKRRKGGNKNKTKKGKHIKKIHKSRKHKNKNNKKNKKTKRSKN